MVPSEKPENTFVPTPAVNSRDEINIAVLDDKVYDATAVVINVPVIV